jgi:DNA (cytosine-5)-methyltransferase 1
MKILNLYACLGGNRYKWDEVTDVQVTAVEWDKELARLYQERFPNDTVIVADAHQYLLDHYQEYDFIWSSPPCPTHSRARFWRYGATGEKPIFPDMKLYQEIIFLQHHFKGKYVVENVIPYYEPMMTPIKRGRHLYWTNFNLPNSLSDRGGKLKEEKTNSESLNHYNSFHDYDFTKYKGEQITLKIARNLVDYEAGKTILETVCGITKQRLDNQIDLFK